MKIQIKVHRAKPNGYWAEVPVLPGCFTQADTMQELRTNIIEAMNVYLELSRKEIDIIRCYRLLEAEVEIRFGKRAGPASKKRRLASKTRTGKPSVSRTPGKTSVSHGSGTRK